jgi:hypothetical protein
VDSTSTGDAFAPNGSYDWTLTVTPADGVGVPLQVRGTVRLVKGEPVRHDHVGDDGFGDLLTLNSSGTLTFQQGTGKGTFSGKVSGNGWPDERQVRPVRRSDGDRCDDASYGSAVAPAPLQARLRGRGEAVDVVHLAGDQRLEPVRRADLGR